MDVKRYLDKQVFPRSVQLAAGVRMDGIIIARKKTPLRILNAWSTYGVDSC